MVIEEGYQGWSNYVTWAVNLWVTNDEPTYKLMQRCNLMDAERCKQFVLKIISNWLLKHIISDIGSYEKLSDVNWEELCRAWNEK